MSDVELIYSEDTPMVLGEWDGKGSPQLVVATGYGFGFRKDQAGYVVGSDVKAALDSHLLVPYDGSDAADGSHPGVPAGEEPGRTRVAEYSPDLGIKPQIGHSQADTSAFLNEPDNRTVFEPAGPASISDEQSDKRPAARRRQSDENRTDANLVAENADNEATARKAQASARPHAVQGDSRENAAAADQAGQQLVEAEADVREGMQANEADKPKGHRR